MSAACTLGTTPETISTTVTSSARIAWGARLTAGRISSLSAGRAQYHQIAALRLEPAQPLPGSDQQQRVAQLEPLLRESERTGLAFASQAHHVELILGSQLEPGDGLADQAGLGGHDDLGHPDVLGAVGEIGSGQRQVLEAEALVQGVAIEARLAPIDQKNVVHPQLRGWQGAQHPCRAAPCAG